MPVIHNAKRWVLLLLVCILTWLSITSPWVPFLDDANLIFHEAGHVIFSLFGDLMNTAGGSIFQILLPLLLAIPFILRYEFFSALLMTWCAGENMIGVGRYIADARAQALELIGGEHDWALILSRWPKVMMHDVEIGTTMRYIGISVMLFSIIGVTCVLYTKHSESV